MTTGAATKSVRRRKSFKIDLKAELRQAYGAKPGRVELVRIPPIMYLMIDGRGDPNSSTSYRDAIKALYTTAYGLKFAWKASSRGDFSVMPLETLWWSKSGEPLGVAAKDYWSWTAMIAVPDVITAEDVAQVVERAYAKAPLEALRDVRVERHVEGPSAQVLHVGSYDAEGPTIELLLRFIADKGLRVRGKHHEIYFSDPRRTAPARLRTLIPRPCGE